MLGFEQQIADLEDRNRKCNIRVYGLREDAEGDAPVQFLERMITTWFPALKQLKPEIERAHRIFAAVQLRRANDPELLSSAVYAYPHAKLSSMRRGNTPL
ncbi:hypothetical protein CesoFtcFv8_025753 [Champsocephalus esox]|uniref:Uncharacterized protein n=1 Tax=Champsocephalus esox TaxID=159716 RepID=A0AAN8B0Z2_9TELE|nr:hypothetical protein CesoFtcFv8_025753 [Champsocephalus esox]